MMTAWLPSYFSDALGLDLTEASQAALFPPIAAIIASAIASSVADHVVSQGAPVGRVRKTAQASSCSQFCFEKTFARERWLLNIADLHLAMPLHSLLYL